MPTTLRLLDRLAERLRRYAAEAGISPNGLLATMLQEDLNARKSRPRSAPPPQRKRSRRRSR